MSEDIKPEVNERPIPAGMDKPEEVQHPKIEETHSETQSEIKPEENYSPPSLENVADDPVESKTVEEVEKKENVYLLITWNQHTGRKMEAKCEIVKKLKDLTNEQMMLRMMKWNGERRLTTADYKIFDLSNILDRQSLEITQKVLSE